jgi:HAD superfamily hydrolase (TIGR01549 family)
VIDTLFLDAGGVIVGPNWTRVAAALNAHGVPVPADVLERADPLARKELDLGLDARASDRERGWHYFNRVLGHAGIPLTAATDQALADLQEYHLAENLWERPQEGIPGALHAFRALGLKLAIVSNANGRLRFLMNRLGLAPLFDVILDSSEEGVEKPDPRLFQIALERSGAVPETTMHVGDLYRVDVEGAWGAGLRAVLLDPLGLYAGFECERVRSLGELAEKLRVEQG